MDDINELVNRVLSETEHDHRKEEIEAWINARVANIVSYTADCLAVTEGFTADIRAEVTQWHMQNRYRIARRVGEALRILLRRELLGEK